MKYPIIFMAVALLVSFVVSETLRSDYAFSYSSRDSVDGGTRDRRSAAPPAGAQPAVDHINYRPYSQVPSNIKQLLQFQQAREPITHIAAQPPPQLGKAATPGRAQYNPQVQYGAQAQAQPQSHPQYQPQPQANYQPQQSPIYQHNRQQAQAQPAYNPQQHQQQQVFRPEQRRLY